MDLQQQQAPSERPFKDFFSPLANLSTSCIRYPNVAARSFDYRKLNSVTRKDHFPLPFIDQMLDRLAGHEFYCFLDTIRSP